MSERLARVGRFAVVGILNTAVDVVLLFALTWAGLPVVLANVISTSVALGVSFLLNRSYTFRDDGHRGRQLALFLAVTLFGLWVLQPIIIYLCALTLTLDAGLELLIGKLAATVVSTIWNYVLYSRLVFRATGSSRAPRQQD